MMQTNLHQQTNPQPVFKQQLLQNGFVVKEAFPF